MVFFQATSEVWGHGCLWIHFTCDPHTVPCLEDSDWLTSTSSLEKACQSHERGHRCAALLGSYVGNMGWRYCFVYVCNYQPRQARYWSEGRGSPAHPNIVWPSIHWRYVWKYIGKCNSIDSMFEVVTPLVWKEKLWLSHLFASTQNVPLHSGFSNHEVHTTTSIHLHLRLLQNKFVTLCFEGVWFAV